MATAIWVLNELTKTRVMLVHQPVQCRSDQALAP
jgi:hypothetical protein